ncbi:MAG: hypothetical protein H7Y36_05820, partial [Armatimonadetes bacterium]|nr:hypothetical protein [Akkermansiaceae bacterium]
SGKLPQWNFSGSAWYWQDQGTGTALVRKGGMPDRAILQFEMAWKNRLSLAIGFHSNFSKPGGDEAEGGEIAGNNPVHPASLPGLFGKSYVLQLYSNYVMLYRMAFDESGKPSMDRVQTNHSNVRLGDSGSARVELRCNRLSGEIVLFVDGEFVVQWSEVGTGEEDGYAGKGDGFGFVVQAENSPVRISEVVMAEWNGMPDAARSMQVDDSDIVLLANGTDRFSGHVAKVRDGKLMLEGRYGDFTFPMDEVAEIRFAKSQLAELEGEVTDEMKVRFHPLGIISGRPLAGDRGKLRILNSAVGEIDVNLDCAVMLEFKTTESFLDDWDTSF